MVFLVRKVKFYNAAVKKVAEKNDYIDKLVYVFSVGKAWFKRVKRIFCYHVCF